MKNTQVPEVGSTIIWCGVPEYDYPRGIFHVAVVAEVRADEQVILENGSRTAVAYCWPNEQAIEDALESLAMMEAADDFLLRCAG